jgi:oligogalacturonide lyase
MMHMARFARRLSRRSVLLSGIAAAVPLVADTSTKGAAFPSEWQRYSDPLTELEVYRLTDPSYASTLPAYFGREITRNSGSLLFCSDHPGSPQAFTMDLKNGAIRQATEVEDLDGSSLTFTPDNRSFCYFAGRELNITPLHNLRQRTLYELAEGWERSEGMTVGPDGTHATFAEKRGGQSRLRMVSLVKAVPRTVLEAPFVMSNPIPRPMRAQVLYRDGDRALWLVNTDGKQNRQLKTADGRIGPADWSPDGKTILYLNFPGDPSQLNSIRELTPDTNTDRLVAKTSQFVHFGFNRDTSVFVGASRSKASPTILLLLRVTRREFTVCEHKAGDPATTAPRFAPDSQRIYFQSDRHGKPAIYCMHVEKLVERTDVEG